MKPGFGQATPTVCPSMRVTLSSKSGQCSNSNDLGGSEVTFFGAAGAASTCDKDGAHVTPSTPDYSHFESSISPAAAGAFSLYENTDDELGQSGDSSILTAYTAMKKVAIVKNFI